MCSTGISNPLYHFQHENNYHRLSNRVDLDIKIINSFHFTHILSLSILLKPVIAFDVLGLFAFLLGPLPF